MPEKKISHAKRSRTFDWKNPAIIMKAMPEMSGLEFIRAMKDGTIPTPPVFSLIGCRLMEFEEGRVILEMDPAEYHYNPAGGVHGGITCTILDASATCAVHSTLPAGTVPTTLEIKINYLRPVTRETGTMRCEGTLIHRGSRTVVAEAKMFDRKGLLYAHAVSTCLIFEMTKDRMKRVK
jgi:uncharacterized protein (TIGR00369 family)